MKLYHALTAIGCLTPYAAARSQTGKDQFHSFGQNIGNSMWTFGPSGVYVYGADGTEQLNHIEPDAVCKEDPNAGSGWSSRTCRYSDMVSDGKKYVWAATKRGVPKITIFDIDSGSIVGNFETCLSPNDLEYHPLRDEIWVRCSGLDVNSTEPTNLDVFSASSPNVNIQTDILLNDRALEEGLTSSGYTIVDNSLGDVGYLTDYNLPHLFKIDLSTKDLLEKIELTPASNGLGEAVYSPINRHAYLRSYVCCTCGFDGADIESCGTRRTSMVTPTTGPSAGETREGFCGSSCEGITGVDSIGVYEYDTKHDKIIGNHLLAEGFGGDPFPSPGGKYIVILGKNGGKTIRILKPGKNGEKSEVLTDLELNFNRSGYEGKSVAKDFAFVERNGLTKVVFASGTEHRLAIVDITNGKSDVTYVTFNPDVFVAGRAPHGRYRQVEWAMGTDYVWVNDNAVEELYVIDVMKEKVVRTLRNNTSYRLMAVQNYERMRQVELQKDLIASTFNQGSDESDESGEDLEVSASQKLKGGEHEHDDNDNTGLSAAAIAIGVVALLVGVLNIVIMNKMRNELKATSKNNFPKQIDQESVDQPSEGGNSYFADEPKVRQESA